ncbi:MAG: hypothetical protein ACI395_04565 [Candidatus Cryptobacteroides sp.]
MKNTDYSFESISSMISSEDSFRTLLDIIGDMDLEILDAQSFRG